MGHSESKGCSRACGEYRSENLDILQTFECAFKGIFVEKGTTLGPSRVIPVLRLGAEEASESVTTVTCHDGFILNLCPTAICADGRAQPARPRLVIDPVLHDDAVALAFKSAIYILYFETLYMVRGPFEPSILAHRLLVKLTHYGFFLGEHKWMPSPVSILLVFAHILTYEDAKASSYARRHIAVSRRGHRLLPWNQQGAKLMVRANQLSTLASNSQN